MDAITATGSHSPANTVVLRTPGSLQFPIGSAVASNKSPDASVDIVVKGKVVIGLLAKPLREHSSFFDNHLSDSWKDPRKRHVNLQQYEADTFELFADWIQFGEIFVKEGRTLESVSHLLLFKAFCLGYDLGVPKFRNYIIDTIIAKVEAGYAPEPGLARIAYEGTEPNSPLRRVLVDIYAFWGNLEVIEAEQKLPYKFLVDLVSTLYTLRDGVTDLQRGPFHHEKGGCHYHHLTGRGVCKHCTAKNAHDTNQDVDSETSPENDDNHSNAFATPMTTLHPADGNIDSGVFGMSGDRTHADSNINSGADRQESLTPCPMPRPFIPIAEAVLPSSEPAIKREREPESGDEQADVTGQNIPAKKRPKTVKERQRIAKLRAAAASKDEPIALD